MITKQSGCYCLTWIKTRQVEFFQGQTIFYVIPSLQINQKTAAWFLIWSKITDSLWGNLLKIPTERSVKSTGVEWTGLFVHSNVLGVHSCQLTGDKLKNTLFDEGIFRRSFWMGTVLYTRRRIFRLQNGNVQHTKCLPWISWVMVAR